MRKITVGGPFSFFISYKIVAKKWQILFNFFTYTLKQSHNYKRRLSVWGGRVYLYKPLGKEKKNYKLNLNLKQQFLAKKEANKRV